MEPLPPAMEAWSLNHWAAGKSSDTDGCIHVWFQVSPTVQKNEMGLQCDQGRPVPSQPEGQDQDGKAFCVDGEGGGCPWTESEAPLSEMLSV